MKKNWHAKNEQIGIDVENINDIVAIVAVNDW